MTSTEQRDHTVRSPSISEHGRLGEHEFKILSPRKVTSIRAVSRAPSHNLHSTNLQPQS